MPLNYRKVLPISQQLKRLVHVEDNKVTFRFNRNKEKQEITTLSCIEFIRRFMMHVLPKGFYKVRYFGILSTANINTKRQQAIALSGKILWLPMLEGLTAYEVYRILTGKDPARCPSCKQGIMQRQEIKAAPG